MKRKRPKTVGPVMEMRAGPAPTVTEAGGRVWHLSWNTQDAKAHLEAQVVSHATREAVRVKRAMGGGPEATEYFAEFQNRLDAKYYWTFGEGWKHVMASPAASGLFLLSLLLTRHPDAVPADAERLLADEPEQVAAAVGVIAPDFFVAVLAQMRLTAGTAPEQVRGVAEQLAALMAAHLATRAPATASA